jgi:hypothetical protein
MPDEARRARRRYKSGAQIIGIADLREISGPDNLIVRWLDHVEPSNRDRGYPVAPEDPWREFERQAGLDRISDLAFEEIPFDAA